MDLSASERSHLPNAFIIYIKAQCRSCSFFYIYILLFISTDCRGFPPSAGLSFSCWFMICKFSSAFESHPVRLLTVVRHMSRAEQQFSCLSVSISEGCLVISTEEETYQFLGEHFHLRLLLICIF